MRIHHWVILFLWLGLSIGNISLSYKLGKLEAQVKENDEVIKAMSEILINVEQAVITNQKIIVKLVR